MKTRIIGDVHGWIAKQHTKRSVSYINLIDGVDNSIQIGDMGFNYQPLVDLVDPQRHKFLPGNHDHYDNCFMVPHCLGDFGTYQDFFFIRGAFSIDWKYRTIGHDWFPQEQLSMSQMNECLALYEQEKPEYVISHECPTTVSRTLFSGSMLKSFGYDPATFTTNTQLLLEECWKIHQPKRWFFGHFHHTVTKVMNGTEFNCIGELEYKDVEI